MKRCRSIIRRFAVALLPVISTLQTASGAEFAVAISPPRFELSADPGDVLREVLEVKNVGAMPADMLVRTADWSLAEDGGVVIYPEVLQPDSCRPWTRIERHRLSVAAQGLRHYRFEVHVPEDAAPGECRFAILFQQPLEDAGSVAAGNMNLPVLGRLAVVVYVAVADVRPELHIKKVVPGAGVDSMLPALVVENTGDAHGRPQGILELEDAQGKTVQVSVSPSPVLPGSTRTIRLWPADPDEQAPELVYPVKISGTVEWVGGEHEVSAVIDAEMEP